MSIWHEEFTLKHVISLRNNNLNKHLGIEFTELGDDYIIARMPVEDHTRQSRGILHGGHHVYWPRRSEVLLLICA